MPTRRDLLTKGLPAAALSGGLLGCQTLLAQQAGAPAGAAGAAGQGGGNASGKVQKVLSAAYADGQFALPPLPYGYDAVEAAIDATTMEIHHDRHHQGYVNGLNKAVSALQEVAKSQNPDMNRLAALQRDLSFNYGGHWLHTLFWNVMGPGDEGGSMGGEPSGELGNAITQRYGSFQNFKNYFVSAGGTVKGSGWVMAVYDPISDSVYVKAINEHDVNFGPGMLPILPLDIWEHAYYLRYQNKRTEYMQNWFQVVDWAAADQLYRMYRASVTGKPTQQ